MGNIKFHLGTFSNFHPAREPRCSGNTLLPSGRRALLLFARPILRSRWPARVRDWHSESDRKAGARPTGAPSAREPGKFEWAAGGGQRCVGDTCRQSCRRTQCACECTEHARSQSNLCSTTRQQQQQQQVAATLGKLICIVLVACQCSLAGQFVHSKACAALAVEGWKVADCRGKKRRIEVARKVRETFIGYQVVANEWKCAFERAFEQSSLSLSSFQTHSDKQGRPFNQVWDPFSSIARPPQLDSRARQQAEQARHTHTQAQSLGPREAEKSGRKMGKICCKEEC